MARYVVLFDWTDSGVRTVKETVDRYEAARDRLKDVGVEITDIYWTLGEHDIVGVAEAPDDESLAAGLLTVAGAGNVRTKTLRAFTPDEMRGVIQKVG